MRNKIHLKVYRLFLSFYCWSLVVIFLFKCYMCKANHGWYSFITCLDTDAFPSLLVRLQSYENIFINLSIISATDNIENNIVTQ